MLLKSMWQVLVVLVNATLYKQVVMDWDLKMHREAPLEGTARDGAEDVQRHVPHVAVERRGLKCGVKRVPQLLKLLVT